MQDPELTGEEVDFAISYAGEDAGVAKEIAVRLRELGFDVFLAEDARAILVGADGELLFERLFAEAKEVVVLISDHYKRKEWTRYEWDVIRDRDRETRFIAVRLDETKILGLPSNLFYVRFLGTNYDEIVETCVSRLLSFEARRGISRPSEYERVVTAIRSESKGALAEAFQLVKDQRKRSPLGDIELPAGGVPSYTVVEEEWNNFSVARRRSVRIVVPGDLSHDDLQFNLRHCVATQFNALKPDAIMVFAYLRTGPETDVRGVYTAGRAVFAPFGKWSKALDGIAYNLPVEQFELALDLSPEYPCG